jgi:hypothetical protein
MLEWCRENNIPALLSGTSMVTDKTVRFNLQAGQKSVDAGYWNIRAMDMCKDEAIIVRETDYPLVQLRFIC